MATDVKTAAKQTYTVRLNVPTTMWARVEVEAMCAEDAIKQAFEANKRGDVSYEYAGFDTADAEVIEVEDADGNVVWEQPEASNGD